MATGGEGSIYSIDGYNMVAKIYKDQPTAMARHDKILAMVKACEEYDLDEIGLTDQIAWPMVALYDQNKTFVGFAMTYITGQFDLDAMYVYPPVKNANISIQDKVDVLIDLCELIEVVHFMGQVFGDFNPDNIKVNSKKSICFLDADSFHIHLDGKTHKCVVCAPGYVAPEVIRAAKGSTYATCSGQTFTKYSDYFALAIHIFRMLMNGVHPFIPQYDIDALGSLPAPEPIDRRVEAGKCPLFKPEPGEAIPPMQPSFSCFPPYLRSLFESAFHTHLNHPNKRPTATDWKVALTRYRNELTRCNHNPMHYHWNQALKCPYCLADESVHDAVKDAMKQASPPRNIPLSPKKTPYASPYNPGTTGGNTGSYNTGSAHNTGSGNYLGNGQYYKNKAKMASRLKGVTVLMAFILQCVLASVLYRPMYSEMFEHGWAVGLATFGTIFFGILGVYLHNHHILENRSPKPRDYFTALLASFGMSMAFIPIAALIGLIGTALAGAFKALIIFIVAIAIVVGLIRG